MELSKVDEQKILIDIIDIKKNILRMMYEAQSGHPGGSLSCANMIFLLYNNIMKINYNNPTWEERDIFILSKGHAAPALYAVLSRFGFIKKTLKLCVSSMKQIKKKYLNN